MWSDLLDLNDILNGFRDGRWPQLQTFGELIGNFDNKRKCTLEQ